MGKKGKERSREASKKRAPLVPAIIAVIVIAVIYIVVAEPFKNTDTGNLTRSFLVKGGETRPIMDPDQFTGMTKEAYAAAKEAPEILDKIYCYCYCDDPPFNHKSLLSCFVDYHGAS